MPNQTVMMQQAFRFALDPTPRQERKFRSHVGGARFSYNWGLATYAAALDAREAEKAETGKATTKAPGHFDLCKLWNVYKDTHETVDPETGEVTTGLAWVGDNFSGTYQAALRDAHGAWKKFWDSRSGIRGGRRVGRPRFKSRHRSRKAFQVHGNVLQVPDAHHVKLPKIGIVKTHESTRKLLRLLRKADIACPACNGTGNLPGQDAPKKCTECKEKGAVPVARLVRATISQHSDGRWYAAITVHRAREIRTGPSARQRDGGTIGIDLGVRDLVVTSDGQTFAHPRHLERSLAKLARAQRAASRTVKGSANRSKANTRVARIHARIGHLRSDATHKLTSALVHGHAVIGVEGWDVQSTAVSGSKDVPKRVRAQRNRTLADANLGTIRWQLRSKSEWYGCKVVVPPKETPTARTCSRCAQVRAKPVPPTMSSFACPSCGWAGDRRINTARVLAGLARHGP